MTIRQAACCALAASGAFFLAASTGSARDSLQSSRHGSKELRVAIVIPRSGPFSAHNRLIANGATVAANENNSGGNGHTTVHLELSVIRVSPTAAPQRIVHRLVRASTHVLVLPCNAELQGSLARAAAKARLLMLSPCNSDPTAAEEYPRYWPVGMTGTAEVQQLVYYAAYEGIKSAFLLDVTGSPYAHRMTGYFREFARRDRIKIVGKASVSPGLKRVSLLAQAIRRSHAAVVFTGLFSPQAERIISSLRGHGNSTRFYGTDSIDAALDLKRYMTTPYNSSLENLVFATFGFPRPAGDRFLSDYAKTFGHKVLGSFPGLGYETIRVLQAAASQTPVLTSAGLDAAFAGGFTSKGVALEDLTYRGHGRRQPIGDVGLVQVIRGQYTPLFASRAGHPTG